LDQVKLEIPDFSTEEVDMYFSPITLDPGRRDIFRSYHGGDDVRSLSTKEYYASSGSVERQKKEEARKLLENNVKEIKTNIPSKKTTSSAQYLRYIQYMFTHLNTLFLFYNFRTASITWNNYRGRQKALHGAVNILLDGAQKYNKNKRKKKKTMMNRKKRKKMNNRRNPGIPHESVQIRYVY
jgi:hypothetical protein